MIEETRPVGESEAGGALDARGIGRVVKEDSTRVQMLLDEAEKLT